MLAGTPEFVGENIIMFGRVWSHPVCYIFIITHVQTLNTLTYDCTVNETCLSWDWTGVAFLLLVCMTNHTVLCYSVVIHSGVNDFLTSSSSSSFLSAPEVVSYDPVSPAADMWWVVWLHICIIRNTPSNTCNKILYTICHALLTAPFTVTLSLSSIHLHTLSSITSCHLPLHLFNCFRAVGVIAFCL